MSDEATDPTIGTAAHSKARSASSMTDMSPWLSVAIPVGFLIVGWGVVALLVLTGHR
jgi:hypothetical protein